MRAAESWTLEVLSIAVLACATSIGCGTTSSGDPQEGDTPDVGMAETAVAATEILNEFSIGGERYSFQLLKDDPSGTIQLVQDYRDVDRLGILNEKHGMLTALEIFEALAPEGHEPHALLVATHESEARAYGRTDLAVREFDGRNPLVEKDSPGLCTEQYTYGSISPLQWVEKGGFQRIDLDGVDFYMCAGLPQKSGQGNPSGCESFHPSYLLRVRVCNDGVSYDTVSYQFYNHFGAMVDPFATPIQPGDSRIVTLLPVANPPQPVVARRLAVKSKNKIPSGGFGNVSYHRAGVGH
jgi:hypothetical protein